MLLRGRGGSLDDHLECYLSEKWNLAIGQPRKHRLNVVQEVAYCNSVKANENI